MQPYAMADEKTPLMDEDPSRRKTDKAPPVYVYLIAACATLNSVNLGFDVGVSSGVGLLVQEDMHLSDWELSLFMGAIQLMAAVGSMCSHWFCDHLGRCKTFTVSQAIFLTGMCLLVTSRGFTQLMISRLFTGFAIGVALAIDPLTSAKWLQLATVANSQPCPISRSASAYFLALLQIMLLPTCPVEKTGA